MSVARAAPQGARLVLLELVVPENASPDYTKSVDVTMMTMVGGRERTAKATSPKPGVADPGARHA